MATDFDSDIDDVVDDDAVDIDIDAAIDALVAANDNDAADMNDKQPSFGKILLLSSLLWYLFSLSTCGNVKFVDLETGASGYAEAGEVIVGAFLFWLMTFPLPLLMAAVFYAFIVRMNRHLNK